MGPCRRCTHPRPRRHPTRRGRGAGCIHHRARALAGSRDARQPGRVDHHDRAQPRDRPAPPRADVRPQGRAAGTAGGPAGRRGRRELDSRRPARARLHLLPPRPRRGGARRAHAPRGRRPDDGGDRPRVPRRRADDGPAARAREAEGARRGHPVSRPARPRAPGAAAVRARRPLPRLQRGLLGDGRRRARAHVALRRGDPAGEAARGADARRAGGARAARADAPSRRAPRRPHGRGRLDRPARGPGPLPLEHGPDRRRNARARTCALAQAARRLPAPGGDRGTPRRGRSDRLAADRCPLRRARRGSSRRPSSS